MFFSSGTIRKKYQERFQNVSQQLYPCNCQPRTDCIIRYKFDSPDSEEFEFQMSFLESYRVYPDQSKYPQTYHPHIWTVGPKLFRDFVSDMDVVIANLGQHYSLTVRLIQDITFIADVMLEDMLRARQLGRIKTHIWRLTLTQHFRNSLHDDIHYGLHEFWQRTDVQVNSSRPCLKFGEMVQRHWTDVVASSVLNSPKYSKIGILDYYEVTKRRGDANLGGQKQDCTHWKKSERHNDFWRPTWVLLDSLLKHNHRDFG